MSRGWEIKPGTEAVFPDSDNAGAIQNESGLRLLVTDKSNPAIRIVLPGQPESDRCLEVIFREHVTVRRRNSPQATLLYLADDKEHIGDQPIWRTTATAWEYEREFDAIHMLARAKLEEDGVRISYELENFSPVDFDLVCAVTDPVLTSIFHDLRLERTYVHHDGGLICWLQKRQSASACLCMNGCHRAI